MTSKWTGGQARLVTACLWELGLHTEDQAGRHSFACRWEASLEDSTPVSPAESPWNRLNISKDTDARLFYVKKLMAG